MKRNLKGLLTKKHITEQAQQVSLLLRVKIEANRNEVSINKLGERMGMHPNWLMRALKRKDHHISLLIALSKHLNHNFLDPYLLLLPQNIRPTKRERELLQQIDDMEKQLLQLIQERDWLKEVVKGK